MGGERLFKLSIFSYCNSVISTFNLNVLFHSIMGLSTLNVVHLTYSTNASLKILRQRVTLVFLSRFYLSGFTVYKQNKSIHRLTHTTHNIEYNPSVIYINEQSEVFDK